MRSKMMGNEGNVAYKYENDAAASTVAHCEWHGASLYEIIYLQRGKL